MCQLRMRLCTRHPTHLWRPCELLRLLLLQLQKERMLLDDLLLLLMDQLQLCHLLLL